MKNRNTTFAPAAGAPSQPSPGRAAERDASNKIKPPSEPLDSGPMTVTARDETAWTYRVNNKLLSKDWTCCSRTRPSSPGWLL